MILKPIETIPSTHPVQVVSEGGTITTEFVYDIELQDWIKNTTTTYGVKPIYWFELDDLIEADKKIIELEKQIEIENKLYKFKEQRK